MALPPDILELAAIGVGIALNPPAVVAVILLLATPRPLRALGFLSGWVAGLAVVGGLLLAVGDQGALVGDRGPWVLAAKLLIGGALVVAAVVKWRKGRATTPKGEIPDWMRSLQGFSAIKAFVTAALFAALNPKTLALNIAGVALIVDAGVSVTAQVVLFGGFVALASVTVALPVLYYLIARGSSKAVLDSVQLWLVDNAAAVTTGVLGVLGVMVTVDALRGLLAL